MTTTPLPTMNLGVLRERLPNEARVALVPDHVKTLATLGVTCWVEEDAGKAAGFPAEHYRQVGAQVVDRAQVLARSEMLVTVRAPHLDDVRALAPGKTVVAMVYPDRAIGLIDQAVLGRLTVIALEKIPRTTRAQKVDVLSSMANLAGYRAVVEAAGQFQRFFGPQVTAAGTTPPAKVLVIGAGVAGLAAVAAARALGAEVRAFDTRNVTREQVESLGATFLTVQVNEGGEGSGGYAKTMSEQFLRAEMDLFRAQAKEVDIVITTALVPGARAPVLLPRDVVAHLRPGSVVVDMAAEQGGNCELTVADRVVEHDGVRFVGFTDLASRMAATASRFFGNNVLQLLKEMGLGTDFRIDVENDIVGPAILTMNGQVRTWVDKPKPSTELLAAKRPRAPPADAKPVQVDIMTPTRRAWGATIGGMVVMAFLFVLGRLAPQDFLQHSTVFILACFVGWQVVWSVTPALHTPLMSVTNAVSGIIIVGGMLQIGSQWSVSTLLGAAAVLVAAINVVGGFFVTQRMLRMFRRDA